MCFLCAWRERERERAREKNEKRIQKENGINATGEALLLQSLVLNVICVSLDLKEGARRGAARQKHEEKCYQAPLAHKVCFLCVCGWRERERERDAKSSSEHSLCESGS